MSKEIILITGGSRGLGARLTQRLAAQNHRFVYFTYNASEEQAMALASTFPNTRAIHCDQKDEARVRACMAEIEACHGQLDVLINNACPGFKPCDFLESQWAQFEALLDVNVKGAYYFSQEAARLMSMQGRGKIINILSSYVLNVPPEKLSFYVTAKYALLGLSRSLSSELVKSGITVNAVSPGMMETDLTGDLPRKFMEFNARKNPMKRLTTPDDVADTVEFLISPRAQFLNGVNIPVNGGEIYA